MEDQRIEVLLLAATRDLSLLRSVQTDCGAYQPSYETGNGGYFSRESDRCVRLNIDLHLEHCGGRLVLHTSNLNTSKGFACCKLIVIRKILFFHTKIILYYVIKK
jgi:hypothetical protein